MCDFFFKMWKFIFVFVLALFTGCQSTPYYSTGSKGAPMSFHESQGSDGLQETYRSVRTLFIIITSLAFIIDVGMVIYQLVTDGYAKKGLLGLLALLFVVNAIVLIFK